MTSPTRASAGSTSELRHAARPIPATGIRWAIRDSLTEASRHVRISIRNVEMLLYATLQPVMFVFLFVYVFGGSIDVPDYDYIQFLVPGIFAQSLVFGSSFTSVGIAEDMQKGYIDRLRSLPMSRSAVLIGRTLSDLARNTLTFAVMFAVAIAVGFRVTGTFVEAVLATLLLLLFSYSLSWIQALIGLSVRSVEAANSAGFTWMLPLTFVSSAFVHPERMPEFLRPIARNNPFSIATNACRALYNGRSVGDDAVLAIVWSLAFIAFFASLSIRRFSRSTVA